MGPRPFGRGRQSAGDLIRPMVSLQWGRDLSVAEGKKLHHAVRDQYLASMGPRPFGRGRTRAIASYSLRWSASMGPRPFGRGRYGSALTTIQPACFNGAATFRSRKAAGIPSTLPSKCPLQWGRDLSVAEGARQAAMYEEGLELQWGRDLSVAEGSYPMAERPYGIQLQWGRDLSVAEGARRRAYSRCRVRLQWGRDLSVAEGSRPLRRGPAAGLASMGPRPFGRGR